MSLRASMSNYHGRDVGRPIRSDVLALALHATRIGIARSIIFVQAQSTALWARDETGRSGSRAVDGLELARGPSSPVQHVQPCPEARMVGAPPACLPACLLACLPAPGRQPSFPLGDAVT